MQFLFPGIGKKTCHAVEGGGERPQFIDGRDGRLMLEISSRHLSHILSQPSHRTSEQEPDDQHERDSQQQDSPDLLRTRLLETLFETFDRHGTEKQLNRTDHLIGIIGEIELERTYRCNAVTVGERSLVHPDSRFGKHRRGDLIPEGDLQSISAAGAGDQGSATVIEHQYIEDGVRARLVDEGIQLLGQLGLRLLLIGIGDGAVGPEGCDQRTDQLHLFGAGAVDLIGGRLQGELGRGIAHPQYEGQQYDARYSTVLDGDGKDLPWRPFGRSRSGTHPSSQISSASGAGTAGSACCILAGRLR